MFQRTVHTTSSVNLYLISDNISFFFFNDTATTEIYTLSLHDALPISRLLADAAAGPGAAPDLTAKPGKDVLELAVTDADKGAALVRLRGELGADAVLYLGDDVTDEDAFRSEERRAVKECRSRWSPYDEKHA